MKTVTIIGLLIGVPLAVLVLAVSIRVPGPGERVLATELAKVPTNTPIQEEPFMLDAPETCVLPSYNDLPKVTVGREGRNGQIIDCSLKAFRELFPGCGNPTTNPEDFSTELFEAWLAANGYDVERLADTNNDGILDPIVYPNQVLIGYWKGGWWSES